MSVKGSFTPQNILGDGIGVDWRVKRFGFTDASGKTLADMFPGALVKFDATRANVLGAVAADDAVLCGIIVDLPSSEETGTPKTVGVALQGTFDKNQVKYTGSDLATAVSAAAKDRLSTLGIYLDTAIAPSGFTP
jgi:hypothetical protein